MSKVQEELRQLRSLTEKDLSVKIAESRKKLISLEQDKMLGKVKNTREHGHIRRSIARMMTILDQKVTEKLSSDSKK